MPEGVSGLRIGGVLEQAGDVRKSLDVRDAREVEVATIRLRFAGERILQVVEALGALEVLPCHWLSSLSDGDCAAAPAATPARGTHAVELDAMIEHFEAGTNGDTLPGAEPL